MGRHLNCFQFGAMNKSYVFFFFFCIHVLVPLGHVIQGVELLEHMFNFNSMCKSLFRTVYYFIYTPSSNV